MIKEFEREITKEFYDRNYNCPKKESAKEIEDFLGTAICCGYGLYGYRFEKKNNKYYLIYESGTSCD